jgi:hypothetical protein
MRKDGGQTPTRAVAADRQLLQSILDRTAIHSRTAVLHRGRKSMLRCQPVFDRDALGTAAIAKVPAKESWLATLQQAQPPP